MRISATKAISVIGIAAVAALGVQYASAAQGANRNAHTDVVNANVDYQYSTSAPGGTSEVAFTIPNPPSNGLYYASFSANFSPAGSGGAPEQFSCSLIKDGQFNRAQDTALSLSDTGFYPGVNGSNVIKIDHVAQFQMFCGTDDGTDWTWGSRPVQVNLIRIDGLVQGNLTGGGAPKKIGNLTIAGSH